MADAIDDTGTRILLIDDNPLILSVLEGLFTSEDYVVYSTTSGKEAIKLLESAQVDIIVCDVMMPEMDGYELHEQVIQMPSCAQVPFVFLTALGSNEQVRAGRESGADDYLVKPFDPDDLLALVKGKVRRSRQLRSSAQSQYDEYRKRVLHTLSHEFRTPLVAINAGTELLLEGGETIDGTKSGRLLEAIRRGGQRLERLVNDFMLLQQIDSGVAAKVYETKVADHDLNDVVMHSIVALEGEYEARGLEMVAELSEDALKVPLCEQQFKEVVTRLLSNAIKFSGTGTRVEVRTDGDGDTVSFSIRDYGEGISQDHIREALKPFSQIDREKMEQQGGGLGLPITQHYVALHQGALDFSLPEGGGTLVRVTVPKVPG